jgi:tetratricopeptide (TPR) repeat protein
MLHELSGNLVSENGIPDRLQVTAVELTSPLSQTSTHVSSDGSFEFRSLPAGSYEVRLTNLQGDVYARQIVNVPSMTAIRFDLTAITGVNPKKAGPVSYYRLSHHVPDKALKLWQKAVKAARAGRHEESAELLDKALADDQQFADALHMRGVYALQAKDFVLASNLLTHAATLDESNPNFLADAAFGHFAAESPAKALTFARQALRLDPGNRKANYVLGVTNLRLGNQGEETVQALEQAAPIFPSAARILNQLRPSSPHR